MCGDRAILLPFFAWGHIWGQPLDRVLSSLIFLGLLGYPDFDPRLALVKSIGTLLKDHAEYEGRSINGEVLYLIRQAIKQYEKDHEQKQ